MAEAGAKSKEKTPPKLPDKRFKNYFLKLLTYVHNKYIVVMNI